MQQLTNKEIARVFAMYYGCTLKPALKYHKIVDGYYIEKIYNLEVNPELSLIPLSKISDEDSIEVAVLESDYPNLNLNTYRKETFEWGIERNGTKTKVTSYYKVWFSGNKVHKLSKTFDTDFTWPKKEFKNATIQYLIQQGYAVPLFFGINHWANNKTAIELGIAIDKTKQP